MPTLLALIDRESDECALWPWSTRNGYGQINIGGGRIRHTHAVACELRHGTQPSSIHEVAHSCGQPLCVNPRHLRWATPAENAADRLIHGTHLRGERHPLHRLTPQEVLAIREACRAGETQGRVGERYGVSQSLVCMIVTGKAWAWLDEDAA